MLLVSGRGIKKSFGDNTVLDAVDFDIKVGARIGLVGKNGAGKTTLANILFCEIPADTGQITWFSKVTMGYLRQSSETNRAGVRLVNTESGESYADSPLQETKDFLKLSKEMGLTGVKEWEDGRFQSLSGGEQTKLALAKVLAARPDILLLDEPTNHMDLFGVEWLIRRLTEYEGTVVIISHDRYFLDRTVHEVIELEEGKPHFYLGNYTDYRNEKRREYETQLQQYYEEKKKQERIEAEIAQVKIWSAKAHREAGKTGKMADMRKGIKEFYRTKAKKMDTRIKSRLKRLERMKEEGTPKPKAETEVDFLFTEEAKHGRRILEVRDLKKSFGERVLFADTSFTLKRGDKVGLFGPNGCGKTTLFQILLHRLSADEGEVWLSPSMKPGYLSQDVLDFETSKTTWELLGLKPQFFNEEAKKILIDMGFTYKSLYRPVSVLSTGEKTRLKIARLILDRCELLFMDEPTNHLDLFQREQLEEALSTFAGTLIIASHDRYMLERLCNRLLVFVEMNGVKKVQILEGGFADYQELLRTGESNRQKVHNLPDLNSSAKDVEAELILLENRISTVLGNLSLLSPGTPEYEKADAEFKELVARKNELKQSLSPA